MEFEAKFIEDNNLTPEQVIAVNGVVIEHVSTLEKEWDGKANENAEGILSGAWKKVETLTGIQRDQGEKFGDALERASGLFFEGTKSTLAQKQTELETKLKNSSGNDVLKQELADTKSLISGLQQKEAEYDDWVKNDYKGKYQSASDKLTNMEQKVAFKNSMPTRPDNVNKYEWDVRTKEFEKELLEKNNLVFDENDTPWLVDKDNEFKKVKLSDAIGANETLQELSKGRQVKGSGNDFTKNIKIDGVPFEVKEGATAKERQTAIKEYLASQGISPTNNEYSKQFSILNTKILGLEKKQADK